MQEIRCKICWQACSLLTSVSPCACSGSLTHLHADCLSQILKVHTKCPFCKEPFNCASLNNYQWLRIYWNTSFAVGKNIPGYLTLCGLVVCASWCDETFVLSDAYSSKNFTRVFDSAWLQLKLKAWESIGLCNCVWHSQLSLLSSWLCCFSHLDPRELSRSSLWWALWTTTVVPDIIPRQ